MSNFRPITRAIDFLLPPSVREWLPERHLARYLAATGCQNAAGGELGCLRDLSLQKVVANQYSTYTKEEVECAGLQAILPWNPVIDGDFITADPIASAITKPIMLGTNRDESIPFLADIPENDLVSGSVYAALMDFLFGAAPAAEILATYETLMPGAGKQAQFEQAVTDNCGSF